MGDKECQQENSKFFKKIFDAFRESIERGMIIKIEIIGVGFDFIIRAVAVMPCGKIGATYELSLIHIWPDVRSVWFRYHDPDVHSLWRTVPDEYGTQL